GAGGRQAELRLRGSGGPAAPGRPGDRDRPGTDPVHGHHPLLCRRAGPLRRRLRGRRGRRGHPRPRRRGGGHPLRGRRPGGGPAPGRRRPFDPGRPRDHCHRVRRRPVPAGGPGPGYPLARPAPPRVRPLGARGSSRGVRPGTLTQSAPGPRHFGVPSTSFSIQGFRYNSVVLADEIAARPRPAQNPVTGGGPGGEAGRSHLPLAGPDVSEGVPGGRDPTRTDGLGDGRSAAAHGVRVRSGKGARGRCRGRTARHPARRLRSPGNRSRTPSAPGRPVPPVRRTGGARTGPGTPGTGGGGVGRLGSLARGILSLAFGALLGSTIAAAAPEISVTPIRAPAGALVGAMLAHRPLRGVSLDGGRARAVRAVVGLSLGLTLLALVAGSVPGAILSVWVMAGVTV